MMRTRSERIQLSTSSSLILRCTTLLYSLLFLLLLFVASFLVLYTFSTAKHFFGATKKLLEKQQQKKNLANEHKNECIVCALAHNYMCTCQQRRLMFITRHYCYYEFSTCAIWAQFLCPVLVFSLFLLDPAIVVIVRLALHSKKTPEKTVGEMSEWKNQNLH